MVGFSSPFGNDGDSDDSGGVFDEYDEFVPANIPEPGQFLHGEEILTGEEHLAFHTVTREIFEERGVYDMTFGYNLARLNLDTRHKNAGYRYARDSENSSVLRAEFTPTTPFCPQSNTLTRGSFHAWNGLADRHDFDLVRVRVDEMHDRAGEINETLATLEESGNVGPSDEADDRRQRDGGGEGCSQGLGGSSRGYSPDAPF
ncbi:MAG: hypothetical protein ACI8VE_000889 [Natrialbaceae archaeon]|jgi:hypothetical protein